MTSSCEESGPNQDDDRRKSKSLEKFVICRGFRYAAPYDQTTAPVFVKDKYIGQALHHVLGSMYRRYRGTQPLEESVAFWTTEIVQGRVDVRPPKLVPQQPWTWITPQTNPHWIVTRGTSIRIRHHVHEKIFGPTAAVTILQTSSSQKWIAIDKPAGIATVDETGGRGINSLVTLIQEQWQSSNHKNKPPSLHPAHRLDKPVSGVLLWGTNPSAANRLLQHLQDKQSSSSSSGGGVRKYYVARCSRRKNTGEDETHTQLPQHAMIQPTGRVQLDGNGVLQWPTNNKNDTTMGGEVTITAELLFDQSIKQSRPCTAAEVQQRIQHRQVSQAGQRQRQARKQARRQAWYSKHNKGTCNHSTGTAPAAIQTSLSFDNDPAPTTQRHHTTTFWKVPLDLDDGTILVLCQPHTGVRHQIRAHLSLLGWPIVYDTLYGGRSDPVIQDDDDNNPVKQKQYYAYQDDDRGTLQEFLCHPDHIRSWCPKCTWIQSLLSSDQGNAGSSDEKATTTNQQQEKQRTKQYSPVVLETSVIWLHSYRYIIRAAGVDVTATPLPTWAQPAESFLKQMDK